MKIVFDKIITDKETLNISLDGGVTSVEKPVNDLLKYGYSFDETECSDLDNIKLGNGNASTAVKPTFESTLNTAFKAGDLRYVQKSSSEVKTYLNSLPANTADNPYRVEIMDIPSGLTYRSKLFNSTRYFKAKINKDVISISESAFDGCSNLTSINIPDSVNSIGNYAFRDCTSLTSVNIPSSVTSIGKFSFRTCTSLTGITIPSSVTSIELGAFCACSGLTSITIPSSVTSIGESVFSGTSLTSINIPDSVTSIGNGAFSDCTSLTGITIPSSVTSIGSQAFYYCKSLTSINYTGTEEQWDAITKGSDWKYQVPSNCVINYNYKSE